MVCSLVMVGICWGALPHKRWGCFILIDRTLGGSEISSALCLLWFFFDDGRHIDIAVMFQIMEKLTHPLGHPKGCVNFKCNG